VVFTNLLFAVVGQLLPWQLFNCLIVDEADVHYPAPQMQALGPRAGQHMPKILAMSATGLGRLKRLGLCMENGNADVAITMGDLLEKKRVKNLKFVTVVTTLIPEDRPNISTFDAAPMSKKELKRILKHVDYLRFSLEGCLRIATQYLDELKAIDPKILVFTPADAGGQNPVMTALKHAAQAVDVDIDFNCESPNPEQDEAKMGKKKRYKVLSSKQKLRRGYDDPSIAVVIFAVPVYSQPQVEQIIGRAVRIHPQIKTALVIMAGFCFQTTYVPIQKTLRQNFTADQANAILNDHEFKCVERIPQPGQNVNPNQALEKFVPGSPLHISSLQLGATMSIKFAPCAQACLDNFLHDRFPHLVFLRLSGDNESDYRICVRKAMIVTPMESADAKQPYQLQHVIDPLDGEPLVVGDMPTMVTYFKATHQSRGFWYKPDLERRERQPLQSDPQVEDEKQEAKDPAPEHDSDLEADVRGNGNVNSHVISRIVLNPDIKHDGGLVGKFAQKVQRGQYYEGTLKCHSLQRPKKCLLHERVTPQSYATAVQSLSADLFTTLGLIADATEKGVVHKCTSATDQRNCEALMQWTVANRFYKLAEMEKFREENLQLERVPLISLVDGGGYMLATVWPYPTDAVPDTKAIAAAIQARQVDEQAALEETQAMQALLNESSSQVQSVVAAAAPATATKEKAKKRPAEAHSKSAGPAKKRARTNKSPRGLKNLQFHRETARRDTMELLTKDGNKPLGQAMVVSHMPRAMQRELATALAQDVTLEVVDNSDDDDEEEPDTAADADSSSDDEEEEDGDDVKHVDAEDEDVVMVDSESDQDNPRKGATVDAHTFQTDAAEVANRLAGKHRYCKFLQACRARMQQGKFYSQQDWDAIATDVGNFKFFPQQFNNHLSSRTKYCIRFPYIVVGESKSWKLNDLFYA
jgi:hypothetical protein